MLSIPVQIPSTAPQAYDIRIAPALLSTLGEILKQLTPAPCCGLISDSNVAPLYLSLATASLQAVGFRVIPHIIPAGEQHKTLATASGALDTFLTAKVERATPIIALGGGVVGDLTGFVAATLLRGLPFIQVPTTLLSAVDASVGGKVAVDHPTGKNLIGAFHQPRLVLTDIATFKSLPPRELRCGLAECIKHAVIRDASLFTWISDNLPGLLACDLPTLETLVARNVAIKAAIVHEDPYEHGVRALLNFGHTFGHAIETVLGYSEIAHGEAISLGMVAAGRLAGSLHSEAAAWGTYQLDQLLSLLNAAGLPTSLTTLDVDKVHATMYADKKVRAGKLRFILPTKIGDARVASDVPEQLVRQAIASLAN